MTQEDQELLSRYLDGELSAAPSRQLELRLAQEPGLQSKLKKMQSLDKTLKRTFNSPNARTVPARIIQMLTKTDQRHPAEREATGKLLPFPARQRKARWSFAVAASIMAASGLLLVQGTGQQLAGNSTGNDALLAQELESAPSRGEGWDVLADGRQIRPLLTYAHIDGSWCREYLLIDRGSNSHGISCRQSEGNWKTEVLASESATESSNEYRTAGAADSNAVAEYIGNSAHGIALSAEKEQQLIARKWR